MRNLANMAEKTKSKSHASFPQADLATCTQPFEVTVVEWRGSDRVPIQVSSQASPGTPGVAFTYDELKQMDQSLRGRGPGLYQVFVTDSDASQRHSHDWKVLIPNNAAPQPPNPTPGYTSPPTVAPQWATGAVAQQAPQAQQPPPGAVWTPGVGWTQGWQNGYPQQAPQGFQPGYQGYPQPTPYPQPQFGQHYGQAYAQPAPAPAPDAGLARQLQLEHDRALAAEHKAEVTAREAVFQQQQQAMNSRFDQLQRELETAKARPASAETDLVAALRQQMQQQQEQQNRAVADMQAKFERQEAERRQADALAQLKSGFDAQLAEMRRANDELLRRLETPRGPDPTIELMKAQLETQKEIARYNAESQKEAAARSAEQQRTLLEYSKKDASAERELLGVVAHSYRDIGNLSNEMAKSHLEQTRVLVEQMSGGAPSVGQQLAEAGIGVVKGGLDKFGQVYQMKTVHEERKMAMQRDLEIARAQQMQAQAIAMQAQAAAGQAIPQPPSSQFEAPRIGPPPPAGTAPAAAAAPPAAKVVPLRNVPNSPNQGANAGPPGAGAFAPPEAFSGAAPPAALPVPEGLAFPDEARTLGVDAVVHDNVKALRNGISGGALSPDQAVQAVLQGIDQLAATGIKIPATQFLVQKRYYDFAVAILGEECPGPFVNQFIEILRAVDAQQAQAALAAEAGGGDGGGEDDEGGDDEPDGSA